MRHSWRWCWFIGVVIACCASAWGQQLPGTCVDVTSGKVVSIPCPVSFQSTTPSEGQIPDCDKLKDGKTPCVQEPKPGDCLKVASNGTLEKIDCPWEPNVYVEQKHADDVVWIGGISFRAIDLVPHDEPSQGTFTIKTETPPDTSTSHHWEKYTPEEEKQLKDAADLRAKADELVRQAATLEGSVRLAHGQSRMASDMGASWWTEAIITTVELFNDGCLVTKGPAPVGATAVPMYSPLE